MLTALIMNKGGTALEQVTIQVPYGELNYIGGQEQYDKNSKFDYKPITLSYKHSRQRKPNLRANKERSLLKQQAAWQ